MSRLCACEVPLFSRRGALGLQVSWSLSLLQSRREYRFGRYPESKPTVKRTKAKPNFSFKTANRLDSGRKRKEEVDEEEDETYTNRAAGDADAGRPTKRTESNERAQKQNARGQHNKPTRDEDRGKSKQERKRKEQAKITAKERGANWQQWMHRTTEDITLAYGQWTDPFVVINKPSGVPVRDEEEGGGDSVFKRITEKFNKLQIMVQTSEIERKEGQDEDQDDEGLSGKDLPDYLRFPSHVDSLKNEGVIEFPHRLDKWTAGLLVVSFNKEVTRRLQAGVQQGTWHKRYRVLAQIPPCLLEKMRTNEEKSILTIDHQPFNNKGYCCMASPLIEGCLVDWKNAGFLRNGVLQSLIGRRLRENNDFVPSVLENVSTDAAICRFCSENHDVIKSKRRHPFVVRHLLYRSLPAIGGLHDSGRRSITEFELKSVNKDNGLALYEASLVTGRTHQLRIHFADAGLPVVSDPYYNPFFVAYLSGHEYSGIDQHHDTFINEGLADMGLQSYLLEFPHPYRQQRVKVELAVPTQWRDFDKIYHRG